MNLLALTSLYTCIAALFFGLIVYIQKPKDRLNQIFLLFSITVSYWTFSEFGFRQATDLVSAALWLKFGFLWPFVLVVLFLFILIFTKKIYIMKKPITILLVYLPALIFSIFDFSTDFISGKLTDSDLGYVTTMPENGTLIYLSTVWSIALSFSILIICYSYYKKQKDTEEKNRVFLVLAGCYFPIIYNLTYGIIPLSLGITGPDYISLGFFFLITAFGYGMWKYGLFNPTITTAAEKIVSTMSDSLFLINPKGRITMANNAALNTLGCGEDQLVNQNITNLSQMKPLAEIHNKIVQQKNVTTPIKDMEVNFKDSIGKNIPMSVSVTSIKDKTGLTRGVVYVGRDLSERKKMEKELLTRNEEIEKLLNQKDEFINQLGHDLKHPLMPLMNLIPLIEKEENCPNKKEIFEILNRNVSYLRNLVVKTVELASLNSSKIKLNFENTNLFEEINKVITKNKFLFEEKKINVINNVTKDIYVMADKLRLEELIENILNNSMKYSKENENGMVTIDALDDKDSILVKVKDNGLGMTQIQLDRIFDEFYKADSSRHDFSSSGLGMSICKRIVEKHGGKIWAESDGLGEGAAFYFTLPRSKNGYNCIHKEIDEFIKKIEKNTKIYAK
ncbi:MAG: PAS domain S-box protein [Candidatus Thermoplasmatota archaeon]|nr:PAS domain S-box protein [Candidatus Thermoplasmatota archaeon]